MNKKILIGVIISICILVGVSFTSVVGYNNIESNIGVSPLFNIRSSRAIDEENENLNCEYVGKGKDFNILFRTNEYIKHSLKTIIDLIRNMDDDEFVNLLLLIKNQKTNHNMKNLNKEKLINAFDKLKNNPYKLIEQQHNLDDYNSKDTPLYYSIGEPWYKCLKEYLEYGLEMLVFVIFLIYASIIAILFDTGIATCSPYSFCIGALCNK